MGLMLLGVLLGVLLGLAGLAELSSGEAVQYRISIRAFIPSICSSEATFLAAWGNDCSYTGLDIDDFANATELEGLNGGDSGFGLNNQFYSAAAKAQLEAASVCQYFDFLKSGAIKAHPDFDAMSNCWLSGPGKCYFAGVRQATCRNDIVKPTLALADSGLFKLQYCSDDPLGRCGNNSLTSDFANTNGYYFDKWYNDDKQYNKRFGHVVDLVELVSGDFFFKDDKFHPVDSNFGDAGIVVNEITYPDPFRAPVWWKYYEGFSSAAQRKHFSFTSEIHTYFLYEGTESFTFSGVFINGILAIDLGGIHSEVPLDINLFEHEATLNLVPGNLYSFDFFHAERHFSESNFALTTTLSAACNVVAIGTIEFDMASAASADLNLGRGLATFDESAKVLQLSRTDSFANAMPLAYLTAQQNVGTGFVLSFDFTVSEDGDAEGFAVVFHRRPDGLEDLPVSTGANLGFRYLTNSFAVAFDLCTDRANGTCTEQRVSINYPDSPDDFNGPLETVVFDGVVRGLNIDNEVHSVSIEYLETPDWIEVYIDNSLYLRKEGFSVDAVIGGREAFVGFTTATSANPVELNISGVKVESVTVAPNETITDDLFVDAAPFDMVADGESLQPTFTILTRDRCFNNLTYGGFAFMKAVFVETIPANATSEFLYFNDSTTPAIFDAEIIDNLDGTYTAGLVTDVPGIFALYVLFDPAVLTIDVTLVPSALNASLDEAVVVAPIGVDFFGQVDQAVVAAPLTASPTGAPVTFAPTDAADNSEAVAIAAAAGGGSGALFFLAAIVLLIMRRKWQRDKAFINEGMLYNMEQDVTYDKNDEFAVVGRMVMTTQQEILRERAQKTATAQDEAINDLELQKAELQEQLRVQKQQKQSTGAGAAAIFAKGKPKATKKQFAAAQDPS